MKIDQPFTYVFPIVEWFKLDALNYEQFVALSYLNFCQITPVNCKTISIDLLINRVGLPYYKNNANSILCRADILKSSFSLYMLYE